MAAEIAQATSAATATLAALAAVFSAICAVLSYRLARSIQNEFRSDERLIVGTVSHPELRERAHARGVIRCPIFNKSKRKAYIDGVAVYDEKNQPVEVTWSDEIDELGMPQRPSGIVGVIDSTNLYIRRNVGELEYARILFSHSFSETRVAVTFDPATEFVNEAVRRQRS